MKKFKTKGLKRRRILIAVGRAKIRMNMVQVTTRDGRPATLDEVMKGSGTRMRDGDGPIELMSGRAWDTAPFEPILVIPAKIKPGSVMVEDKENPRHFVWRSTAEVCDPAYWRGR